MFDEITAQLAVFLGNPLYVALFLGFLPISEVRGAAIYAFSVGQPWLIVPAAISNILAAPVILAIWDLINIPWWGRLILGEKIERRMRQMGDKYEHYGVFGIALFVGIPLPVTGAYTGTLIARLLGIKRRKILLAVVLGVAASSVVMYLLLSGLFGSF
ncbi:MAG: COG2426 family protein [Candidatus Micrarchaeia archaeon]